MLNKAQLDKLNDIFHTSIKPVLEKREKELNVLIEKVDEYKTFVESKKQKSHYLEEMILASIKQDGINTFRKTKVNIPIEKVTVEKTLQRDIDLNSSMNSFPLKTSEASIPCVVKTEINPADNSGTVSVSTELAA